MLFLGSAQGAGVSYGKWVLFVSLLNFFCVVFTQATCNWLITVPNLMKACSLNVVQKDYQEFQKNTSKHFWH